VQRFVVAVPEIYAAFRRSAWTTELSDDRDEIARSRTRGPRAHRRGTDGTRLMRCIVCKGPIAAVLAQLGSLFCHDCRGPRR